MHPSMYLHRRNDQAADHCDYDYNNECDACSHEYDNDGRCNRTIMLQCVRDSLCTVLCHRKTSRQRPVTGIS
jgi:hypothetical protein